MAYLALGVAVFLAILLMARWITTANPATLAGALRALGWVLAIAVPALLLLTGRLYVLLYALPFLLPFLFQWRASRLRQRAAEGPTPGGSSDVDTGWLRMALDHDTGEMRGTVQRGRFVGRELSGMSRDELLELREEVRADADSVRVLEAYLDRVHGAEWRGGDAGEHAGHGAGAGSSRSSGASGAMTEDEALEILGLEPGAGAEAVKAAHRRLMARMHPDRGGSTYLAAKLNAAKDLLLKRR